MDVLAALKEIRGLDRDAMDGARRRQDTLLKPVGSLGRLEDLSIQIAGITGQVLNALPGRVHYLFAADNGVYDEGVAAAPQALTGMLLSNYADGGCAINILCEQYQVDLRLVDIGVKNLPEIRGVRYAKLMNGTGNIAREPAMSRPTAIAAMQIGFDCAVEAKSAGYKILGTGEVGMGNTTTAAACILAALQDRDYENRIGRGAGLSDEGLAQKKRVIQRALELHADKLGDPVEILSAVGGLDIAALTGLYIGAAYVRLPIVIDGVISIAAALLAYQLQALTREFMIPSHTSEEPAFSLALHAMSTDCPTRFRPLLDLNMRLGEGTGCPPAMDLIDTALSILRKMVTMSEVKQSQSRK